MDFFSELSSALLFRKFESSLISNKLRFKLPKSLASNNSEKKSELAYKRVLLKLSGEVFKGESEDVFDGKVLMDLAKQVKEVVDLGCEVGIVIGGGNIWRFRDNEHLRLPRVTSDMMGMLATVMNALAFEAALNDLGCEARAMSALGCEAALERYSAKKAKAHLAKGRVVIFAGGTGSPFFTTDSAAALRALEIGADVLLKATKVDFVYDKDPKKHADAVKYEELNFEEVLEKRLGVMDLTCAALCQDGGMPMVVFNLEVEGNILKVVRGEDIGTQIKN